MQRVSSVLELFRMASRNLQISSQTPPRGKIHLKESILHREIFSIMGAWREENQHTSQQKQEKERTRKNLKTNSDSSIPFRLVSKSRFPLPDISGFLGIRVAKTRIYHETLSFFIAVEPRLPLDSLFPDPLF